ncbi:MAG: AI-2E family transporter, partial [Oscillospiraceae bacterium]
MKFSNKKYNIIAAYTLAVIGISILMVMAVFKFDKILDILLKIIDVLMPVIWGLAIAYILNPVMVFTEKRLNRYIFRKKPHKKAARRISVGFTIILLLLLMGVLISFVVPELSKSIKSITNSASDTILKIQTWINNLIKSNEYVNNFVSEQVDFTESIDKLLADWQPMLQEYGTKALDVLANIAQNICDFVLGIIVSVYLLLSKETL